MTPTRTLLRNARLVGGPGAAVDLLLRDDLIAAIGPALAADGAEVLDLDGRFVHPGLWDAHVHGGQWAQFARRLDVSDAASAAEVGALVRARVATDPPAPGEVLMGAGFRDGLWPDAPTAELLDVGDVPVALVSGDVHTVWSNRAVLRRLGRPDHQWLLREQAAFDLNVELSAVPEATLDRWVLESAVEAAARGVVGIRDLEMDAAPSAWARRFGGGFRGLRVKAAVYPAGLDRAVARGIRTGRVVDGSDGLLVGGPFKLFTDGSLNTRTAWCDDPYPGLAGAEARGLATHEPEALLALAREALALGLVPTIHAIGDAATALALDTFAALGPLPSPGSIEHAQLVRDADLPRFAELGVVASVQPQHALDDRDVADHYWAGRTGRAFAYRALVDAGAELMLGSDAPVAPLDPWVTIAAAVHRSHDGRAPWHAEQQLTAAQALAASSGGVRALVAGGAADLVVLDADPLDADPGTLRAMPVHATYVAGRRTF
jgi:predicted amidohydrolase YtcJ